MLVRIKLLAHFWGTALGQGKRLILSLFSMMMTTMTMTTMMMMMLVMMMMMMIVMMMMMLMTMTMMMMMMIRDEERVSHLQRNRLYLPLREVVATTEQAGFHDDNDCILKYTKYFLECLQYTF